jgi:alanine racemase
LLQTVLSEEYAAALNANARSASVCVRVHVAINTGMNRIGLDARSSEEFLRAADALLRIKEMSGIEVSGMYTHFSTADEETPVGEEATARQLARYRALREEIERRGMYVPFHHVCNSAAAVRGVAELFDGARLGILLYGVYPALSSLPLQPVMRLCARVVHVFRLPAGERVGYGGEYCAETEKTVAVIAIGYADGWLRAYRGACVRVHADAGDFDAPVLGRVCMDQCMLDVTGKEVRIGDTVTLFGADRAQLASLSERAGSIDYEGLCLVSSRVLRVSEGTC